MTEVRDGAVAGDTGAGAPSVALVHDYLVDAGGAERVLADLCDLYTGAPIYTSLYAAATTNPRIPGERVRTSFLQPFYPGKRYYQLLLPFFPLAFRLMRPEAAVVLSSASAFAKGVRVRPDAVHVCYCYTPPRFAWRTAAYARQQGWGLVARTVLEMNTALLRRWDRAAASGVDYFVAMSGTGSERIYHAYGRSAAIIPPPVDTDRFVPRSPPAGIPFFLTTSRLIAYKRIDLAVAACSRLGLPLKVVGTGPDLPRLRRLAGPTVEFLGRVSDAELAELYAGCAALIQPGEEDFGLTPLEANAAGRPVIAYRAGGALDSVRDGETGILFPAQTPEALAAALAQFQPGDFDPQQLRAHALTYSSDVFKLRIARFVEFARRRGPRPSPDEPWLAEWQALDAVTMQEVGRATGDQPS
ncbi:MAG: glycosyltransferase [Chloroflexi bacterium]|nr:glycosyltransferase [Chloroflexota bacterium]